MCGASYLSGPKVESIGKLIWVDALGPISAAGVTQLKKTRMREPVHKRDLPMLGLRHFFRRCYRR